MKRFEFVEHTADVAVKVQGGSLKELFGSAALAMFSVLVAQKGNGPKGAMKDLDISKSEEKTEDVLKAWLDELLFHYETGHWVLHRVKSMSCSETAVEAKVLLEKFTPERFEIKGEIKAVTYHELKVEKARRGWEAFIIFDT
jgi:SHS2 domain-containing protein